MSFLGRARRIGEQAARSAYDAAMRQPEIRRRVESAKVVLDEARDVFEHRFEQAEADLWTWIQRLQAEAERVQRQVHRAQSAHHHYDVLGVKPGATIEEVKSAWRQQMRHNHPDRFAHDAKAEEAAHERALEINEAYRELTALLTGRENRRAR